MTRLLAIACLSVVSFVVGSCEPNPGSSSSRTPTVLVFKHGKLSGDPQAFQALLKEFETQHPGLVVREEILPASTDQQHQYYVMNLEGRTPTFDLLAADVIWVPEFARAGWIQSLDQLLPATDRKEFFPATLQAATFEGRPYAIPWHLDVGVLYYRRDLLERYGFAPPGTWADLVRIARMILEGERNPGLKGFVWQGKQYEGLLCVALEFIWGNGAELLVRDTEGKAEAALAFMRDLIRQGTSPALVATADEEAARHLFQAGRAVFMRNWSYAWSLLQREDSPVRDKVGLAPLPSFPKHPSASVLGGWMLAVPRGAARPTEAQELIRFLTSSSMQRRMALQLGYNPVRRRLYEDPELEKAQPWLTALYPVVRTARPRLVTPYYLMVSQVLQPEVSAVVVGRRSAKAALASARRQIYQILGLQEDHSRPSFP